MFRLHAAVSVAAVVAAASLVGASGEDTTDALATQLRGLDGTVLPAEQAKVKPPAQMLAQDVRARREAVNQRETRAWHGLQTRADWERYRDPRLQALRESLGPLPPVPADLKARVTRTLEGNGFRIANVVFESRPGLVVTANLYVPAQPAPAMPGILICHSHHNPKAQGELQDMGMTWARLGCLVLVLDQLGHGERRQHPFRDETSYPHAFRPGRQDYYFRYNVGMQLHLIGDSLIGWMAWDLMRGVDLLLAQPGIDKERILLLGSVAGGGDPAAVTAALDPRITAVVPFNFGGPEPETVYPLPADAEQTFNYAGSGSWESTRNLRLSARDGFLPWVIVGGVAPRRLIYAHEFAWDRARDPVWARLEKIYTWYGARDHLAAAHGRGQLSGKPPESTHCNNIGPEHRKEIYPTLKRWFDLAVPDKEYQERRPAEDLVCLTPEVAAQVQPRPVYELAGQLGAERMAAARRRLAELPADQRRLRLRQEWTRLLGEVRPATGLTVSTHGTQALGDVTVERVTLHVEREIVVPLLVLTPRRDGARPRLPVVVGLAQEGKQRFLRERAAAVAQLLRGGSAVCLPDLRGTGETTPAGDSRGRASAGTSLSSSELMLGQTLLGARLRDLLAVLDYLGKREELDGGRVALWGESFAPVNPPGATLAVPLDAAQLPHQSEPLGDLLALLGALFDDHVRAACGRGGLAGYHTLLQSPFCYVPHDVIVPGALTAGDLADVAAALAPRPVRLEGLVDGLNRAVGAAALARAFEPARAAYQAAAAPDRLALRADGEPGEPVAEWLLAQLKK
jgi:dienelactone hydrolase